MLRLRVRPCVALGDVFGSELRDCLRMAPVGSDVNANLKTAQLSSTPAPIPTEIPNRNSNRIQWISSGHLEGVGKDMNFCLENAPLGKIMFNSESTAKHCHRSQKAIIKPWNPLESANEVDFFLLMDSGFGSSRRTCNMHPMTSPTFLSTNVALNRSVMMCYNCHNCNNSVTICADRFTWHHGPIWRRWLSLSLSLQDCITSSSTTAPGRSIDLHKWPQVQSVFSARLRVRRALRVITGDYGCWCFFQVFNGFNGYIGPKRCKPYGLRIQTRRGQMSQIRSLRCGFRAAQCMPK